MDKLERKYNVSSSIDIENEIDKTRKNKNKLIIQMAQEGGGESDDDYNYEKIQNILEKRET